MESVSVLAVETALPPYPFDQATARCMARTLFADRLAGYDRLERVFDGSSVKHRRLVQPPDWYLDNRGWAARMSAYARAASALLEDVARKTIEAAGVAAADVDHVVIVSTTGFATPSLDADLIERIGLRPSVCRTPIFGLGCAGGALGLARASTLARGEPGSVVLLLTVETCSLAFRPDPDPVTVIGLSLFGDGAAGAILTTREAGRAIVLASGEHCWPGTKHLMGWRIEDPGLGLELGQSLPAFVRDSLPEVVDGFLDRHRVGRSDLDAVVLHPGGPKVLDAMRDGLGLQEADLDVSRSVLRSVGNLSSAAVLFVLQAHMRAGLTGRALLAALGPGFTAGLVLLEVA